VIGHEQVAGCGDGLFPDCLPQTFRIET
jgi:hypothetical protein